MKKYVDGVLVDLTEEEITERKAKEKAWSDGESERNLNNLRAERNSKLAESDWMANSDVTMSDSWKKYRQELRDITKTYKSLDEVKWPTAPSE
tara:strand:- start:91 stop:369 length:279 start_codon:yes stop_codon:yes gene_type:complete